MNNQILQKTTHMLVAGTLLIIGTLAYGQHPGPQPIDGTPDQPGLDWTLRMTDDGMTSIYQTGTSVFPEASEPFKTSSPSNLLPTLYVPMIDAGGDEIPNTLPSTPEHPYNLHPDPIVSEIDPRSPRWDLGIIINQLQAAVYPDDLEATNQTFFANGEGVPADPRRGRIDRVGAAAGNLPPLTDQIDYAQVDFAIDILEGNPIDRTYSGMALLNYKGPSMIKTVDPDTNMVTVHQSWQHSRIMSDAMFIDPSTIPDDEPWTVRYVVDNLFWGEDDFAPFAVYFDDPDDLNGMIRPHIAMDQSFFTMLPGHRYVFDIAMAPHRYYNLTYNWGWRNHPPRIQAVEKATKQVGGKNIVQWERDIFGDDPTKNKITKLRAISMLSDLAPAKRMWYAFQALKVAEQPSVPNWILQLLVDEAAASYDDWTHRQRLPRGIHQAEGDFDQTIVYLNNILYGGMHAVKTRAEQSWREWQTRGAVLKVKLLNGDYFPHLYMNVDFGGRRGWENIYQHTLALGHQGPLFTFGRAHWSPNLSKPAEVPAADRLAMRSNALVKLSDLSSKDDLNGQLVDLSEFVMHGLYDTLTNPTSADWATELEASVPPIANNERAAAKANGYDLSKTPFWLRLSDTPPALARTPFGLGEHNVEIEYRFDPSQRLRFYQFDPSHHNQDILSIH